MVTSTGIDHRHLRGCNKVSFLILSEIILGIVINHHDAGAVPLFRIRIVALKENIYELL
jgi:hypothetical protein